MRLNRYEGYVILASFLWGTSFAFAKMGVETIDPFVFSFLRFALGSLVLFTASVSLRRMDVSLLTQPAIFGLAVFNSLGFALQHLAMTGTTATNVMLLVDIDVIFVAMLSTVVLKERIDSWTVLGIVIGFAGVVLVSTEGDVSNLAGGTFIGNIIAFGAGIVWAVYIVYQKRLMVRESNVLGVTTAVILWTTALLFAYMLLFASHYDVTADGFMATVYTGIFCSGLAFLAYNAGLRGVGATASSVILLLEIVFGIVFAVLLLREYPNAYTAAGGALIVMAIAVISFRPAVDAGDETTS